MGEVRKQQVLNAKILEFKTAIEESLNSGVSTKTVSDIMADVEKDWQQINLTKTALELRSNDSYNIIKNTPKPFNKLLQSLPISH